ncbi:AcrR family transcriptional regulator [Kutzneria buriramensis]|uniref:AcrR family transcriptional regulator n=1 Tax=Kutzneria buriramensis TaxID=1045776 RepID=A0A3E0HJ57_9PSEU|nr:AcrR family transcriptional regulator [Kutzneria buriramensis]
MGGLYAGRVPKLWTETVDAHRAAVREAILDTAAALVAEQGLTAVTMSRIAERAGIGRATLYKYFPDVEAILVAWHERHVADHLRRLTEIRDQAGAPGGRLDAALEFYAFIAHNRGRHNPDISALLHHGEQMVHAQRQLLDVTASLLAEAAAAGEVRDDIEPAELAAYCLHALGAASGLPSQAAVRRLVKVTTAGLRPSR